jgi:sulfate adenylyltransferase
MTTIKLNERQFMDCINLADGLFEPLSGFLTEEEFTSVVLNMRLPNGEVWINPLTLDVSSQILNELKVGSKYDLLFEGKIFGSISIKDIYKVDKQFLVKHLFGTDDIEHPGVALEFSRSSLRIAGEVNVHEEYLLKINRCGDIKNSIKMTNAKTFVGFQTRNPPHRAHEYLQRTALEVFDGLLINPLVGWKKSGDFSEAAVKVGYDAMMKSYYKERNVILAQLKTTMLYAGPKEALHHALMRRNMGCTHFIVGRDHAGVGNYYSNYAAHELITSLINKGYDFGINFLLFREPTFCHQCEQVVTDKICGHNSKDNHEPISGSKIREYFNNNKKPPERYMRPEVTEALNSLSIPLFIP